MYLDIVIGIILVFTIIEGIREGFLVQFFSIFGVVVDFILAKKLTPIVMDKLSIGGNGINYLLTYAIIFILLYLVVIIIMYFIGLILKHQNKGVITRLLGGVFGALKGILVSVIILLVFNYASEKYSKLNTYSKDSVINRIFLENTSLIEDYLPKELKESLNNIKGKNIVDKYFNKIL